MIWPVPVSSACWAVSPAAWASSRAHVENLHHAAGAHEQVGRLDVAVHDAHRVGIFQPLGRLEDVVHRLRDRQRAVLFDQRRQVAAIDELHHQKMRATTLVGVEGGDDVRVDQPGGGLGLAMEPLDRVGRADGGGRKHLQGHEPMHAAMLGLEHHAHAPLAKLIEHQVVAQQQAAPPALVDLLRLVVSQLFGPHERPGKLLAIGGARVGRQRLDERPHVGLGHEAAVGQALCELVERGGHG
jgi:hypothetical protein